VALMLRRRGITRVRPLAGGLAAWREKGYPLETRQIVNRPVAEAKAETANQPVEENQKVSS
jgi:3-mercaptopyruvate sulfurtransferase SseA